jgi:hypothetical protein
VKTVSNDQVSVTVCRDTGDILLDVQPSNPHLPHIARWLGLRNFEQRWTLTEGPGSVAYAQETAPIELAQTVEILCQRMASPAIVLRKVRYSNGVCYEQQIIEFRIIYLQRKQSRLLPESHHQGWALAHPLERATSMDAQLGEGARAEVG